jgi:hypothetical protein
MSAARQFSSAMAPFAFAFMMQAWGTSTAISLGIVAGALAVAFFSAIALLARRPSPFTAVALSR